MIGFVKILNFSKNFYKIHYESAFQGFRLVGRVTKNGKRTRISRLSINPTTIKKLNNLCIKKEEF